MAIKRRVKKPYIAATLIVFLLCFMVKNVHAASFGTASVDGKSFDVEKVIINSTLKSRTVSTAFYQIKMPEMTVKTPVATTCYWNKANEDRRCIQTVEIDNAGADLALKEAFGSSTPFKNLVIRAPEVLKKGTYNVTYEFDYPTNKGEEWNLTFATPTVTFLIDPTISACSVLNATNETYLLTDNITAPYGDSCLYINSDNITVDCQGYSIIGDASQVAIDLAQGDPVAQNIIIKNCIIFNVNACINTGYNIFAAFNNTFENSNYIPNPSGSRAVDIQYCNATIYNNSFLNNAGTGIYIATYNDGIYNSLIYNNTFLNNSIDIGMEKSDIDSNITFYDNFFNDSNYTYFNEYNLYPLQGLYWNATLGNFWTNSTSNGYSDTCDCTYNANSPYGGFCDAPYVIDENNTDYLPLCVAEQECVPSWNCTAWGECVRGTQTRTCYDNNFCDDNSTIPALSQQCIVPYDLPNATFNVTGGCCPVSTFACYDNDTVIQLWNTSDGVSFAFKDCQGLGCQNGECNYPTWINALIIVIIAGVALYLIYKVV